MGAILRLIICFGIAFLLLHITLTGELSLFLNPRLQPLILITAVLLMILGWVQVGNMGHRPLHRTGVTGYLLLLAPLLFYFLAPPSGLDVSMASKKGVQYLSPQAARNEQFVLNKEDTSTRIKGESQESTQDDSKDIREETAPASEEENTETGPESNNYYEQIVHDLKKMPVITLGEKTYLDRLNTLQMYEQEVTGKEIKIKGFIFYPNDTPDDMVLISRYAMTCCAADASVVGIFTRIPKSDQLKEGTWVEVQGVLEFMETEHGRFPFTKPTQYHKVDAPKDPYVYANY